MNEAPPPWEARPDALETDVQEEQVSATEAQTSVAPKSTVVFTPTSDAAKAPASGSVMENWYRNRRQKAGKPSTAIDVIKSSAQGGDSDAQYELGMLYQSGSGIPQDMAQARRWLTQAAQGGNVRAQYALALFYRTDDGGQDINQSINWQRKAAQSGYAEAQYGLGLLYANGQYVNQDNNQARNWFQQAAQQGHVAANLALLSQGDTPQPQTVAQAPLTLEDGAAGRPPVQPEPVQIAAAPVQVELPKLSPAPQLPQAAEAPRVAPDKLGGAAGNPGPASNLDLTGVETSVVRQSAEAGDKQAQLMMGTMYEDGVGGLPSDLREAAYWYEQAARQGYTKAQYNLGLLYEDGRGVKQDYKQAAYWYDKAAKNGFTEAQNNLGVLFILGKGVKQDKRKAAQLFKEAASTGNENAQRNLDMLGKG